MFPGGPYESPPLSLEPTVRVVINGERGSMGRSLRRFLMRAKREIRLRGEVNVLLTNNQTMRALNRKFRKKNKATDVLSFPAAEGTRSGGDVAI